MRHVIVYKEIQQRERQHTGDSTFIIFASFALLFLLLLLLLHMIYHRRKVLKEGIGQGQKERKNKHVQHLLALMGFIKFNIKAGAPTK